MARPDVARNKFYEDLHTLLVSVPKADKLIVFGERLANFLVVAAAAAAEENASVENRWCQLRDTVQSTALVVLSRARRKHQGWFDDDANISNLLAEKNRLHKSFVNRPTENNKAAFYRSRRLLQQQLWEMQEAWMARKATANGATAKGTAPLPNADGTTLLTEKTQILQRWAEHIRGVLNRPSTISDAAIARLPLVETNVDFDIPPSLYETSSAVLQLSSGKTRGSDAIPAETYKHGLQLMDHLITLYGEMWCQEEIPQDFKDATVALLYKLKGNRQLRDNNRGISVPNIAGKVFVHILLDSLNSHL
ncbi:hypothetical protein SprV_0301262600 [Sparganum proliferum]